MIWKTASPYAVTSGDFSVCKNGELYLAWKLKTLLGVFHSAAEAKQRCEREVKSE